MSHLESGNPARTLEVAENETDFFNELFLLTSKPVLYIANTDEESFIQKNSHVQKLEEIASSEGTRMVPICAKLEEEIGTFDEDEKHEFLNEIGADKTGLEKLISESYSLLDLISFLTAGPKETRAWTIKRGTKAPQAAGKIHSDMERGFIRAEVIPFETLKKCKNMVAARDKGLIKSEGKDYTVQDGDVILFRFNV
jgi:hypothetical protein